MSTTQVRLARPEEYADVSRLTLAVYVGENLTNPGYAPELADVAARAAVTDVLVAVRDGRVVGAVAFAAYGSPYASIALAGEAEFRMLAVDPAARGQGVGEALVRACLERALAACAEALVLSTQANMVAAQRLYVRLGFQRVTERDWSPLPGVELTAYRLGLTLARRAG